MKQDLKGKKLMMMSGSQKACEIVNVAHQMGIIVYETDWYEDSPAKKVVDKAFMVSTADVDAVVDLWRVWMASYPALQIRFCHISNRYVKSLDSHFGVIART